MLPPISFTFNVSGDADPTRTFEEIIAMSERGTQRVSQYLRGLLEEYLSNWEIVPVFVVSPVQTSRSGYSATIQCEISTEDILFWWISRGVQPYSFSSDNLMKFPYMPGSRYASYDPKTGTGATGPSKLLRHGPWNKTHFISERDIRPRDIPAKAKEGHREDIGAAFMEGFR